MKNSIFTKALTIFLSIVTIITALPMAAFAVDFSQLTDSVGDYDSDVSLQKDTFEVVGMREESVKYFRLADGTYLAAQYDSPVHYLNESGEWSDIDNTLSASGGEYSTNDARVKFAKKITGNEALFTLHDGNAKITMSLDGAQKKVEGEVFNSSDDAEATVLQKMMNLEKLSSKIIYANILDGVDLEYVVESNSIKENIIVKEKKDSYTYTFTVKLNNLNMELLDDGSIVIFEADATKPTYTIPAPVVFDNNGEYAGTDEAHYGLVSDGNGCYKLSVTVNAGWMNEANRAYPVTIDPPIFVSSENIVTDTYINSYSTDLAPSSYSYLYVGNTTQLYWKTASLPTLPESAYITDATFAMTLTSSQAYTTGMYFGAYQVITDWDSTLTWSKFKDTSNPQGTYNSTFTDFVVTDYSASNTNRVYTFDVTQIVKNWYNGDANYGICVSDIHGYTTSNTQFCSNEATVTTRPKLCITFKDMKGVEDYWTYSSQTVGNAGVGSVNNATGTLSFAISTLSTTDSLMPYMPTLVYNSAMAGNYNTAAYAEVPYSAYVAGKGFKWSMNESIVPRSYTGSNGEEVTYYVWSDADGTEHYFVPTAETGVYADEDGLLLTLTTNGGNYKITDSNYTVRTFTKNTSDTSTIYAGGILQSITDKSGNQVKFTYNEYGRISYVSLIPVGSSEITYLKITHNSSGLVNRILNETTQEAVIFYYSTTYSGTSLSPYNAGFLRKVERAHQTGSTSIDNWASYMESGSNSSITSDATATYSYDSAGRLIKARDELSRYEVNYTYTGGKVTTVQEKAGATSGLSTGQSIKLNYYDEYTVVRNSGTDDIINNSDDILTTYSFDEQGRTISIYSADVSGTVLYGASNGEYVQDNDLAKNSLAKSAQIGSVSSNYILNGSFEDDVYNSSIGQYVWAGSLGYWTTSGTVSTSHEYAVDSRYAANLIVSSGTTSSIEQYVFLPAGDYTLSFDVYTHSADDVAIVAKATSLSGSSVFTENVSSNDQYASGKAYYASRKVVAGSYTNGGEYFKITIQATGGAGTASGEAIVIDNVMLSNSIGSGKYDMVRIGNFESTTSNSTLTNPYSPDEFWGLSSYASITDLSASTPFGNVLTLAGAIDQKEYASQIIYRATAEDYEAWESGEEYDLTQKVYTISGFAKGTQQVDNAGSTFRLIVEIQYYKGEGVTPHVEVETFDFVNSQTDWQFVSGTFVTNPQVNMSAGEGGLVEYIRVACEYENQPGIAYFDSISVTLSDADVEVYGYSNETGNLAVYQNGRYTEWYVYGNEDHPHLMTQKVTSERKWYTYEYDAKQRVIEEVHSSYTGVYSLATNNVVNGTVTDHLRTEYTYDSYGLLTRVKSTNLESTSTTPAVVSKSTYDVSAGSRIFGALLEQTDSLGQVTRYFYDEDNGDLLATINPDESTGMAYSYDAIGNLVSVLPASYSSSSDSYSSATNSAWVAYDYDSFNRLSDIYTDTTTYTFTYDTFGNTDTISAGNYGLVDYTYNSYNGKLYNVEYGNGFSVRYVYDDLDRVSEIWYTNSTGTLTKRYTYSYTADGNLSEFCDVAAGKAVLYQYDASGRMSSYVEYDTTSLVNLNGSVVEYNDENLVATVHYVRDYTYSGSTVGNYSYRYSYQYDSEGNVSRLKITHDTYDYFYITPTYDGLNRLSTKTVMLRGSSSDTVSVGYSYTYKGGTVDGTSTTSVLISKLVTSVDGVTSNTYNYTYDSNGNITRITNASGVVQYQYVYDDLGQLVREDNRATGYSYEYYYDNGGNITAKKRYAFTTGALGTAQETISYTYADTNSTGWGDLLTSFNGDAITYDEIGNPTSIGSYLNMTWEGRRLVEYDNANKELIVSFTYNDEGIRTSKTVDGTTHTYTLDGSTVIAEEFDNYLFIYMYDETGSPIGFRYRTKLNAAGVFNKYIFEKNLQGDIIAIYNESGSKIATYTYDAWGNSTLTYTSGITSVDRMAASTNPFRYRGYFFDSETGLYYVSSRYYDPEIGRFINADDIAYLGAGGLTSYNIFAYCCNNPVMGYDPYGTFDFWGFAKGVGRIVTGIAAVAAGVAVCVAGAPVAMIAVAAVTITAGVLTAVNGAADIQQSVTGNNFVRDTVFNGNQTAYDVYSGVTETVAAVGTAVCGNYLSTNCTMKGAVPGTEGKVTLEPGTTLDRYGSQYGRYLTDPGTPINQLALTPGNSCNLTTYVVNRPFTFRTGVVAPCAWGPGGGVQYFSWMSVQRLVQFGFLIPIG